MKAIDQLKTLYMEENRRRYPSLPESARSFPKWSDKTANGLTKCIIDFLRLTGAQAERVSVTGRYIDNSRVVTDCIGRKRKIGSGRWIKPSMQPGTADISATIAGKSVKIEVKINDRQSKEQKAYQEEVENAGGIYLIVRSFDEFHQWYKCFAI